MHRQTIDSHLGCKVEDGHITHTVFLSLGRTNGVHITPLLRRPARRMIMAFDQQILQYYEELTCGKTVDEHESLATIFQGQANTQTWPAHKILA